MKKVFLITDKNGRAGDVKNWFRRSGASRILNLAKSPARADFFLSAGGDGTLLHAIRLYGRFKKPFFGLNRGTHGVLLNQVGSFTELEKIVKNFSNLDSFKFYLLQGEFFTDRGKKIAYAFNDFYLKSVRGNERLIGQVSGQKKFSALKFDGDGLIVSTPQGSTAYNYTAGGKILPLNSKKLSIKAICSRQEINLAVPEQKISVVISRGQAVAYADHARVASKVRRIVIRPSRRSITIMFKRGQAFKFRSGTK